MLIPGCFVVPKQQIPEPTSIPIPIDPANGGFWYYEDQSLPTGYDPVFATWSGKVILLKQNGQGWDHTNISMDDLLSYKPINPTGQHSDYGYYVYYPEKGEIHLQKDGSDKVVAEFHNEYNPDYWIWAWTSLMFIKAGKLHIYYVRPDGSFQISTITFQ